MIGAAASLAAGPVAATPGEADFQSGGTAIAAEWFAAENRATGPAPAVLLLHGADGLAYGDRYRLAAGLVAGAGFHVGLLHYLDRTGERRVAYSTLRERYPLWLATIRDGLTWAAGRPDVDPDRLGILGVSLGAALALSAAAANRRVRAVVGYSGPCPEDLSAATHLPPTLILHGESDRTVPVREARKIGAILAELGTPHEIHTYPGQGHALSGAAQLDAAARTAAFLAQHLAGS